ncbi:MAG: ISAs1 family transposase [Mangrovibacterium sp.]
MVHSKKMSNSHQKITSKLFTSFESLEDPRRTNKGNLRHPLEQILFLVVAGLLSKCTTWVEIEIFGKHKISWLRKFYDYKNGIPSHDTMGVLFSRLDYDVFSQCFMSWSSSVFQKDFSQHIAIDGKTIRGSGEKFSGKKPFHVVSAYASAVRLTLAQSVVDAKSNEIPAISDLLDLVDIQGHIVSSRPLKTTFSIDF